MDIKNIERKDGKVSFQVTVDAATFERAVNEAYQKAKKNIYIPGFRKGKAPRVVIEGMYGTGVFYEDAIEALAPDAYMAGLAEAKDRTVGSPAISNYDVAEDKTLTISFEAELYPEVTLGEYKGLKAYKAPAKATADDVKKELENIRNRNARIVAVERAAKNGDTVNIDYDGYLNGERFDGGKAEGHDLKLGSGSFVPGFEEQLVGLKAGDEKDIDITFPENYHAELAGKAVVFKVKVNEVKETQLPALDDEFAKDVSEFDTLKEYKADLKKNLEKAKAEASDNNFRGLIIEKAAANMTANIPAAMIDERVNRIIDDYARNCAMQGMSLDQYFGMMGIDEQTFRGYVRPGAETDVKVELMLEKVAEVEALEVTAEEIEEEYKKAAEMYNMELDKLKEAVAEEYITHDLRLNKASKFLADNAVALDEPEDAPAAEAEAKPAKKTTKKAAEKTEEGEAKPAAKKTAKKAAEKTEDGEAKPAAKKTTAKKTAEKKTEE